MGMRRIGFLAAVIATVTSSSVDAAVLFEDDALLQVTLVGPIRSVIDNKNEHDELPFVMEVDGRRHTVHIRARGKSRLRLCQFPLLRLRFEERDIGDSVFAGQVKLKLVTQCNRHSSARADLLQEYAAYRIFNAISDVGYRVRLLRIKYVETSSRDRGSTHQRYGFVVESDQELGTRIGGSRVYTDDVSLGALNKHQMALAFVFHYLIGNADYSLVTADGAESCCHNGHLYELAGEWFLVPNDFDLSGLVNARYARSNPTLAVRRVRKGRYRGYCISADELAGAVSTIVAAKVDILRVIDETPGLQAKERAGTKKYLGRFFRQAEDSAKLLRYFEKNCIGP